MSVPASSIITTRPVYQSTFDSNHPTYKCCCGSIHVVTGGIIIGILEIFGCISSTIGLIVNRATGVELGNIYAGFIGSLITLIVVALMFVGINKKQHQWIIPHLVLQTLGILGLLICAIQTIIISATLVASTPVHIQENDLIVTRFSHDDARINGQVSTAIVIVLGILLIIAAVLEIWFLIVILKLCRFLRDQAWYLVRQPTQYLQQHVVQTYPAQYGQQQFAQPQNMYPRAQQDDQPPPPYTKLP